ncbi:hypothetical protein LTR16_001650 [Cryomyces antarcticus]|uniref:N-acetylglucosamine-induced protein 1 n=1 Tax=Cryomyces antarcticus TaxID=329879 RepID=A0ABR0M0V5_9PEZI|nr:hypothetical protein LTR16_001650 [Cryomyces antarcticus]
MLNDGIPSGPLPFKLNAADREVLAQTDEDFHLQTWEDLKRIISENRLEILKRRPSDLKRYIIWTTATKAEYGTIQNYILQKRLHWTPLPSADPSTGPAFTYNNPTPFADPADYKILRNDWPYGLAPGIVHLCVWTKTPISTRPEDGDVTPQSRELIEFFVERTFTRRLEEVEGTKAEDRVLWFKNWTSLQSVRGIDHVHVLLRDAPEQLLKQWMG